MWPTKTFNTAGDRADSAAVLGCANSSLYPPLVPWISRDRCKVLFGFRSPRAQRVCEVRWHENRKSLDHRLIYASTSFALLDRSKVRRRPDASLPGAVCLVSMCWCEKENGNEERPLEWWRRSMNPLLIVCHHLRTILFAAHPGRCFVPSRRMPRNRNLFVHGSCRSMESSFRNSRSWAMYESATGISWNSVSLRQSKVSRYRSSNVVDLGGACR